MCDLVPWTGAEPTLPAMEVRSLNHWTTREAPEGAECWAGPPFCLLSSAAVYPRHPWLNWAIQRAWAAPEWMLSAQVKTLKDFKYFQESGLTSTRWYTGERSYSNQGGQQGAQEKRRKLRCPERRRRSWSIAINILGGVGKTRAKSNQNKIYHSSKFLRTTTKCKHLKYPIWYQWKDIT